MLNYYIERMRWTLKLRSRFERKLNKRLKTIEALNKPKKDIELSKFIRLENNTFIVLLSDYGDDDEITVSMDGFVMVTGDWQDKIINLLDLKIEEFYVEQDKRIIQENERLIKFGLKA